MSSTAIPAFAIVLLTLVGSAIAVTIFVTFAQFYRNGNDNQGYGMRPPGQEQEVYMRQVRRRELGSLIAHGAGAGAGETRYPPPSRRSYGYGYGGSSGNKSTSEETGYIAYPLSSVAGWSGHNNDNSGDGGRSKRYSSGLPSPMTTGPTPPSAGSVYYVEDAPASFIPAAPAPAGYEQKEYFHSAHHGKELAEDSAAENANPAHPV
jgi:hypothetical protein